MTDQRQPAPTLDDSVVSLREASERLAKAAERLQAAVQRRKMAA